MTKQLLAAMLLLFAKLLMGQDCFDRYNLLFENGNDTLNYKEFHKLELKFLDELNGCKAPDFHASTLDETYIQLSDLKGKVVVLNFWFTTCLPCLKEIPELNKLVDQYDPDEVVFIGLARDSKDKLNQFFDRFGAFFFNIIPESYDIATIYKIVEWPQTMIIDKSGKIYKSWAGLKHTPVNQRMSIENAINTCIKN